MKTFREKAGKLMQNEFCQEVDTPEGTLKFHSEIYQESGDPIHLLAAFCYYVYVNKTGEGAVSIPEWITNPLTQGFTRYLDCMAKGEAMSLEHALGISPEFIQNAKAFIYINEMIEHVHIMRWLFGLKVNEAVHVTYQKYKQGCESLFGKNVDLNKNGITQNEESFKDNYERYHSKKRFPAWVEKRDPAQLTEHHRQQILSTMSTGIAGYVKRKMNSKVF